MIMHCVVCITFIVICVAECLAISDSCTKTSSRIKPWVPCGKCMCSGNVARCQGRKSSIPVKGIPNNVRTLHLEGFVFQNLTKNFIPGYLRLNKLNFTNCDIDNLNNDAFSNLTHLSELVFQSCHVHNKAQMIFAVNRIPGRRLITLRFQHMAINSKILKDFIADKIHINQRISTLDLEGNRIELFNITFFSQFPRLQKLVLYENTIHQIVKSNGQVKNLKYLDLGKNHLRDGQWGFCQQDIQFPSLEKLILTGNYMSRFGSYIACLRSLKHLDISDNIMTKLNFTVFEKLNSLEYLKVSKNWLSNTIGHVPGSLKTLDLKDNQIPILPPLLCPQNSSKTFPNLTSINLNKNLLKTVYLGNWTCLTNLARLDMGSNRITSISNNTLDPFKKLAFLKLDHNFITSISPEALKSSSLKILNLNLNSVKFSSKASLRIFENAPNIVTLFMSYMYLGHVTKDNITGILAPLKKLEKLYIKGTRLNTFPAALLTNHKRLKVLTMGRNNLRSMTFPGNFSTNLILHTLDISDNDIKLFHECSFPESLRKSLKCLNVQRNPLECDCDAKWFRDQIDGNGYMGQTRLVGWPKDYVCHSPLRRENLNLSKLKLTHWECEPLSGAIIACITAASCLLVFSVVATVSYCKRWHIQYWWHYMIKGLKRKKRSEENAPLIGKPSTCFDVYVIYNEDDTYFVEHTLKERLEDQLGYRLFLWNRDAGLGRANVEEILDGMDASNSVIVVLSKSLVRDKWAKFQIDVALNNKIERKMSLFLVRLKDLNLASASNAWCVLIAKIPGATWCDNENDVRRRVFDQEVQAYLGEPLTGQAVNTHVVNDGHTRNRVNYGSIGENYDVRKQNGSRIPETNF